MSFQVQLSENQRETLVHGLRVAAEVYEKHAADIVQIADEQATKTSAQVYTSLVDIFRKQATDTRALATQLEECGPIRLLPADVPAVVVEHYDTVNNHVGSTLYTVAALRAVGEDRHADKLAESLPRCASCGGRGFHNPKCAGA